MQEEVAPMLDIFFSCLCENNMEIFVNMYACECVREDVLPVVSPSCVFALFCEI